MSLLLKAKHKFINYLVQLFKYLKSEFEKKEVALLKLRFNSFGKDSVIPYSTFVKNPQYINIGDNFYAMSNIRIEAWDFYEGIHYKPFLSFGDNVIMNTDIHIGCIDKVQIGNNVLFASRIFISDHSHGEIKADALSLPPSKRLLKSKGPVIIEDNVWIGEGVAILPGVTIGENTIIGANSVVTKSFPQNSVIAGNPARLIRRLL